MNRIPLMALMLITTCQGDPGQRGPDAPDAAADLGATPDLWRDLAHDLPPPDGAALDLPAGDLPAATGPLRLATFNCWCLQNSPAKRAKGIALEIQKLKPDAVGLQEVCQSKGGTGADNFAATLAAELKALTGQAWEHRFARTHEAWGKWDEGVGLLAPAGRIKASGELALPKGGGSFPRKAIWARVSSNRGEFYLYSAHLTISAAAKDRQAQAAAIVSLAAGHATALPQVVVGDFNDWYASSAVTTLKKGPPAFTEAWGAKHPGASTPGLTCCHPSFSTRIDYIFVKTATLKRLDTVSLAFTQPYGGQVLSDHRGLFAAFTPK